MTLFPYNSGVPASNDDPSVDQPVMLANAIAIAGIIAVDHVGFNFNTISPSIGGGNHKVIHFQTQGSNPVTVTGVGQEYTRTVTGDQQLFYKSGNGNVYQLTSTISTTAVTGANGVASSTNYSFLPNGMKVITGYTTNSVNGGTITLSSTYSTFLFVGLTPQGNSSNGTNRALVAQPRTVNPGGGTMVINLQDVNNNAETVAHVVYFYVVAQ
jgi:hypothetical protein